MPGRMITSLQQIRGMIKAGVEARQQVIVNALCYVGETCINIARDLPSPPAEMRKNPHQPNYIDNSENLRSSIGYAVVLDGKVVQQTMVEKQKDGDKGESEGKIFLEKRINKARKKGIVLIVTAGMNYAEYVEARGYEVLTPAELKAPEIARNLLTRLGFVIK